MPVLKNSRHERFAQELASGKTATEAFRIAGYRPNDGNCGRLKKKEQISTRVAEILDGAARRVEITRAKVLEELSRIGFANMIDYVRTTDAGDVYVNLSALDRERAAPIQEVVVDTYVEGRGEEAREVKRTRFKLADKRAALVDIAKINGWVIDKHEHSGKDGGPIETREVSALDEVNRRISGLAARGGAQEGSKPH